MICKNCAEEADALKRGETYQTWVPAEGEFEFVEFGSMRPRGHAACRGCDCMHKLPAPGIINKGEDL